MSMRGWILAGVLLALIASFGAGVLAGRRWANQAHDLQQARSDAQVSRQQLVDEQGIHDLDLHLAAIDVDTSVHLARLQVSTPHIIEESRHAIDQRPDLAAVRLPAALVRLRRQQAEASARIAAEGAGGGPAGAVSSTGP